ISVGGERVCHVLKDGRCLLSRPDPNSEMACSSLTSAGRVEDEVGCWATKAIMGAAEVSSSPQGQNSFATFDALGQMSEPSFFCRDREQVTGMVVSYEVVEN